VAFTELDAELLERIASNRKFLLINDLAYLSTKNGFPTRQLVLSLILTLLAAGSC
jgi:hypothetical protein